jgi:DNA polymerase
VHKPLGELHDVVAPDLAPRAQHVLHFDAETYSPTSLKNAGAHRYANDQRTGVRCVAHAVDHEPAKLWLPGDPVPPEFVKATHDPDWIACAHNAVFEMLIVRHVLVPCHGFPLIPPEKFICTMAMAQAVGLPARLDHLADALELSNRKDSIGARLMQQMSRPRKARKDEDPSGIYYFDDQERLDRLYAYCKRDVESEREAYGRLPALSLSEHSLWQLSCKINDRGFHIDRSFALAARKIAQAAGPEIDAELVEITGGAVTKINQIARLMSWLKAQGGFAAQSLDRKAVEKQLEKDDLPPPVRRVLELRLGGAQSAVKKIDALLARAGDDDRVRGAFKYHGAGTGRFAGEGFQPQNLKRPEVEDIDAAIAAVSTGDYEHVKSIYSKPLAVVGDCSRSMIAAAPGCTLVGADFSSVESRVLSWVSGEQRKLETYRRFDATHDPHDEPYRATAALIFHTTPDAVTKEQRAVGKVCDLALGYQGGLNAFRKFEPNRFTDDEVQQLKKNWRSAHPPIKRFWYAVDRAAYDAVHSRGRVIECGPVAFKCAGAFLWLKLPSGRKLAYPFPRLEIEDLKHRSVIFADNAAGQFKDCRHGNGAYGGLWTENVVSGIARDLLAEAMLRIEAAGYLITLHVHDECVCEVPIGFGSTEEFTQLMTHVPGWATGLPIAAGAWIGPRYRK